MLARPDEEGADWYLIRFISGSTLVWNQNLMLKVVLRSSSRDMVERKVAVPEAPSYEGSGRIGSILLGLGVGKTAFHRVMQIPTHMLLLRAKMRRDLDTSDTATAAQVVRRGRSVSGGRKVRAYAMRSSGKSCRFVHVIMGSGSGGMVMCFARLGLGADTAIDSSRGCKNSTPLGDDMVVVASAAAVTGGTLSLVLDPTAAECGRDEG